MTRFATFKRMQDSTREDWEIIKPQAAQYFAIGPAWASVPEIKMAEKVFDAAPLLVRKVNLFH